MDRFAALSAFAAVVDAGSFVRVSWFRIYPTLDVDRGLLSGLHAGR